MLSADELEAMRETLVDSLPDLCTIKALSTARDDQGGTTKTWANTATNVPCRLAPADTQPQEGPIAERLGLSLAWMLTLPAEQVITPANRVAIGSRTFEVVAPLAPRSDEICCRVLVKEVS